MHRVAELGALGGFAHPVSRNPKHKNLIAVLREAREFLARPDNNFAWSSWDDAAAALREVDGFISRIEVGEMPDCSAIELLFLPTGPIQAVSLSSGWGQQFHRLADRFDAAVERAYGEGLVARLRQLVSPCGHR